MRLGQSSYGTPLKRYLFLFLFFLSFQDQASALVKMNPFTGKQDFTGVSVSSDLNVPCPSGQVMLSSGGGSWACGSAGAPTDAQYIVGATDSTLTQERVLTEGTAIDLGNEGANLPMRVSFDSTEVATTTWGSGSPFVWTLDAGATDPTISADNVGVAIGPLIKSVGKEGLDGAVEIWSDDGDDNDDKVKFHVDVADSNSVSLAFFSSGSWTKRLRVYNDGTTHLVQPGGSNSVIFGNTGNFQFPGSFNSTNTGSLGWAVVDGTDNTACTSQCTNAAVFGFNLAAGATAPVLVGPADTTADICLCAGSS